MAADPPVAGPGRRRAVDSPPDPDPWLPEPRPGQWVLVAIGMLALPPGLLATWLRVFPPDSQVGAMAASFVAYGVLAYGVSLLAWATALLRARRRTALAIVTTVVAVLTGLSVAWQLPLFVPDGRPARTAPVTVMTLNLHGGGADGAQVWAEARNADLVFFEEFDNRPAFAARPDWTARFPYSVGYAESDPDNLTNTVIFSRYPLHGATRLPPMNFDQWLAVVTLPELGDVTVMAVHPCSPLCGSGIWPREQGIVRAYALLHRDGPLIVGGDFNAVDDHLPLRELRRDGLVSATDLAGAGWLPTYPADRRFPPLLPIDHILLSRQLTATSIRALQITGTDHRGLVATVAGTG